MEIDIVYNETIAKIATDLGTSEINEKRQTIIKKSSSEKTQIVLVLSTQKKYSKKC